MQCYHKKSLTFMQCDLIEKQWGSKSEASMKCTGFQKSGMKVTIRHMTPYDSANGEYDSVSICLGVVWVPEQLVCMSCLGGFI